MSALLDNGIEVTALHNHFLWDEPRMYFMHVHAHGKPADLARKVKPALDLIGKGTSRPTATPAVPAAAAPGTTIDTAKLGQIVGTQGEQTGAVVAIHHHITGTQPTIYFLHYWGTGPAEKLATVFKAALSETGKIKAPAATKQ